MAASLSASVPSTAASVDAASVAAAASVDAAVVCAVLLPHPAYSDEIAQDFHLLPYSPLPAAPAASYSVFKFVLTILYHIRKFTQ